LSSEALNIGPSPATPGEPRWALTTLYALAMTALVGWAAWPGMMTYDTFYAIQESRTGITTMLWPPMHAYLFWLGDRLGVGPGGVLVLQVFLLFFGAALSLNLLVRRFWWALAGLAAFTLSFVYIPELMGTVIVQWRDVTTTSFAVAGVAFWLLAARQGSTLALVLAAVSIGLSLSLRYNAVALFMLILPLMAWSPFLGGLLTSRTRGTAVMTLVFACGLALASLHVRLPDLKSMPSPHNFAGTQQFDLFGISACADTNYLPPSFTGGWPITPKQIREVYDPRHLNYAFRPNPGAPAIKQYDAAEDAPRVWPAVVAHEIPCYLAHRTAVMVEQMGLARDDVFQPGYFAVGENPYGLKAAHPMLMHRTYAYVSVREKELWRRPALVFLLAPIALALVWRRSRTRLVFAALLAGAYGYVGLLFVAAPAADFRYIFPPTVFCCLLLSAGGAVFVESLGLRRAREAATAPPP
jgi:hypothetical protein